MRVASSFTRACMHPPSVASLKGSRDKGWGRHVPVLTAPILLCEKMTGLEILASVPLHQHTCLAPGRTPCSIVCAALCVINL
jgi:hypothetical protein